MFGTILEKKEFHTPKNIVFSPHVDDEVIGCFLALEQGLITDVVYFYDLEEKRLAEAYACSAHYKFKPWFCKPNGFMDCVDIPNDIHRMIFKEDRIFCPTASDSHIDHAKVNKIARRISQATGCELVFYTVDMNSFQVPLENHHREMKKNVLENLFPSQKALFENEKYFLFEGYTKKEHLTSLVMDVGLNEEFRVIITGFEPPDNVILPLPEDTDETYLDRLILEYYNRPKVSRIRVYHENRMVEFNG